jgi:NitT/TauT family transport system ATP-binding protein
MSLFIKELDKSFPNAENNGVLQVLKDIDLEIRDGEFVCLVGPTGCGKTTLLQIIAGLTPPTSGEVLLGDINIAEPTRQIGLVFQEYALFPWRTVLGNIEFGLEMEGVPKQKRRVQVMDYIRNVELEGFEHLFPKHLSGGMKQRVAIARTMINNPQVLLMDEPFSSVDSQTRNSLQEFLLRIWKASNNTVIFVTHNIDEAVFLSQRVLGMSALPGRIKEEFIIDLPYPRVRTQKEFVDYRAGILNFVQEERSRIGIE